MKVGDLVRVINGTGYFEDGDYKYSCMWSESAGQVGIVVELPARKVYYHDSIGHQETVKILVAGEFAEFKRLALEVINESR